MRVLGWAALAAAASALVASRATVQRKTVVRQGWTTEMDYDINNSSVIPMIHAALMNEENRYEAVLKVARKARQRAVLEQMSGGPSDSEKPLLAQLREELEVYDARKREAQRAANAAMAAPVE